MGFYHNREDRMEREGMKDKEKYLIHEPQNKHYQEFKFHSTEGKIHKKILNIISLI
jgi:hypothetical protein